MADSPKKGRGRPKVRVGVTCYINPVYHRVKLVIKFMIVKFIRRSSFSLQFFFKFKCAFVNFCGYWMFERGFLEI